MICSEIFDTDIVGREPGLEVWEMENFLPAPMDPAFHGSFYEEDCYIILKTTVKENHTSSSPTPTIAALDSLFWRIENTTTHTIITSADSAANEYDAAI